MSRRHRALVRAVSDEEYASLLERQGGVCAICRRAPKTRRLHVDHDHHSMTVRGLLCHRCNRNLPTWVTEAWLYDAAYYLVHGPRVVEQAS